MPRVLRRESAKRDLTAQWVWYAENAGLETADRFLTAVESTAITLARQPESGARLICTRSELQGLRRFPVSFGFERILFFYFPLAEGIEIVRVLHGSRDLGKLFD